MDFTPWGNPSKEWQSFAAANSVMLGISEDHLPPLMQQANTNKTRTTMSKHLFQSTGLNKLVATQDHVVPTRDGQSITVRSYRPVLLGSKPLPGYVYHHGGGFIFGALDTELFNCSWLAHSLSMTVVHVCYRHTPQVQGLTPWHDALDGFEWVATHTEILGIDASRIVVGGISAGASLTAQVVQSELRRARETGAPNRVKGQVLGIPSLLHWKAFPYHLFAGKERTSMVQCKDAPILNFKRLNLFSALLGDEIDPSHPTWSPGLADEEDLKGMPPAAFLVAGLDPLRDEGLLYATKLKNAGVRTNVHIFPGLPHVFYAFVQLPSHKRWNEAMLGCLRWAAADEDGWIIESPPVMPSFMERAPAATSSTDTVIVGASKSNTEVNAGTTL
ncbi:alpha/beta-hydrolase [Annulohypoxylon maeteangense]|uniref:alpha/beta-hydrolase n=1 Tax=Annulohypoxylon maeteangense TaxID=1927788 RepID=UPI0020079A9D|nr:alpha/beta-hydrolase [Annulohypoxylon maeteangense]KAI0882984.1 alpha/beta-hydrolase [Annulohypoxylon maeteangense]